MDLFEYSRQIKLKKESPLAFRLRPKTLNDFIGQEHIMGPDKLLYRAILADKISSIIFFGPTGTGKTTLAKIIANTTSSIFEQLNATISGIKDIKQAIDEAKKTLATANKRTILFIDEIHRFNKTQQDALLPYVEDGTIILIGATTENPYFEVNKALLSRSTIFELKQLDIKDIKKIILKAITDKENGMGIYNPTITDKALEHIACVSNGDARAALNAIELAVLTTPPSSSGEIQITIDVACECIQKRALNYDKTGDNHYDTISAFIKSMRGSDPDAAVYYLAKMLYAGEDPKFIARRIIICASEDVGNADPNALLIAVAAAHAVDFIGMPECRINLAQAVTYIACAKKSNASYLAIDNAYEDVKNLQISDIPLHLTNAPIKDMKKLGRGVNYKYPHDYPGNYIDQQYLPDSLVGKKYYTREDKY